MVSNCVYSPRADRVVPPRVGGPARCQPLTASPVAAEGNEQIGKVRDPRSLGLSLVKGSWLQSGSNFLDQTFQGSRAFGEEVEHDG